MRTPRLPRIYACGKIRKNDWRMADVERDAPNGEDPEALFEFLTRDTVDPSKNYVYCGPYYVSCDHGCGHGGYMHGAGLCVDGNEQNPDNQAAAQRAAFHNIQRCDFMYARLDAIDAYGSLVEIGYAAALRKSVLIEVCNSLSAADAADMWFALRAALNSPVWDWMLRVNPFWLVRPGSLNEYRERLNQYFVPACGHPDGRHGAAR